MSKKVILLFVISVITLSCFALDQEQFIQEYGDRKVAEITVNGLKRTTEKTLINWI